MQQKDMRRHSSVFKFFRSIIIIPMLLLGDNVDATTVSLGSTNALVLEVEPEFFDITFSPSTAVLAESKAKNSLGQIDVDFDSATMIPDNAFALANVTSVGAEAEAQTDVIVAGGGSVSSEAITDVAIEGEQPTKWVEAEAIGQTSATFVIDGFGDVEVDFFGSALVNVFLSTDEFGTALFESALLLEIQEVVDGELQLIDTISNDLTFKIGRNSSFGPLVTNLNTEGTVLLSTNTTYVLNVVAASRSFATTVPEPSTLGMVLAFGVITLLLKRKH